MLLSLKANVNSKDHHGNTALHLAIQKASSPKIVNMLLKKGTDINICNLNGRDPIGELHYKMRRSSNKENALQNGLNEFNECFIKHIKEQYNNDCWYYFQLSVQYT